MELSGLHLLLTYKCTLECDHCFTWGSPWQCGTMTLEQIRQILQQARELGTVRSIYFEGGEPFLYYAVMLAGVRLAAEMGFQVGIVSNSYWATSQEDALQWLRPLQGLLEDLSVSSDMYHWDEKLSRQAKAAMAAAQELGIPIGLISISEPDSTDTAHASGQLPPGESAIMYRGRAVRQLIDQAARAPWEQFSECPYEDLRDPGRVHVDPLGHLHVCQGLSVGNLFEMHLARICERYDPDTHPVVGPLLAGGPAELVRRYALKHASGYADACHLCYEARLALRPRFPDILAPDQMYGAVEGL
jgi:hypothetical protein